MSSRLHALVDPTGPRIGVWEVGRPEVVLGAFQRLASAVHAARAQVEGRVVTRRLSGGPAVLAGPGSLHLVLSLPSAAALVPCDVPRLVNRYVRPLLVALGRLGAKAHYFGRDWVSAGSRPVAWIGWAHDAASGVCLVESVVAVSRPFAPLAELDAYPARAADPFLGKVPATLEDIAGRPIARGDAASAILGAYDGAYAGPIPRASHAEELLRPPARDERPPWGALVEEAIGFVGAGAGTDGRVEVGGDLLASEDLPGAIARELGSTTAPPSEPEVASAIDRALASGPYVMHGVKHTTALVRVVLDALTDGRRPPSP